MDKPTIKLTKPARNKLLKLHEEEESRELADRLKAILLLDKGCSHSFIADGLLLNVQTIENYEKCYLEDGLTGLLSCNDEMDKNEIVEENESDPSDAQYGWVLEESNKET